MNETGRAAQAQQPLEGVDRLFGRDLRSTGWFVKTAPKSGDGTAKAREDEPQAKLDPAMIWSMRGRRRR
ncbi:MAG: hypothetical protein AB7G39_06415 [Alphaproteobacteria bacterium]